MHAGFVLWRGVAVLIRGIIVGIIRIPTTSWDKRGDRSKQELKSFFEEQGN